MTRVLRMASVRRLLLTGESCRYGIMGPGIHLSSFSTKGRRRSRSDGSESSDDNLSKKDLALQQALDQIIASFGKLLGRVVEIYGPEASGKTTLALHAIAEAHKYKYGGYCAFLDAEHALDPTLDEAIGVKTDNLLLSQPDNGERALSLVDTLVRSGAVDVVVVDSLLFLKVNLKVRWGMHIWHCKQD